MIAWLDMIWLRPIWWLLVPVALILGATMVRRASSLGAWERAMDASLLQAMRRMGRVSSGGRARNVLPAGLLLLLGIALAGPAAERRDSSSFRNLDAVVLVVDLSPSVTGSARLFDTLTAARLISQAAQTRQTALIVFAGEAYLATQFSSDPTALTSTLALLDAETMPVAGSRPEVALSLARATLEDASILAADVVLFSDGGGITPAAIAEARALNERGWRVSTVQVPGRESVASGALTALAQAGDGVAANLANPFPVADRIASRPLERLAMHDWSMLLMRDYGRYLLLIALVPAFLMLPRGRSKVGVQP